MIAVDDATEIETACFVYGIVDSELDVAGLRGLDDVPVELAAVGDVAAAWGSVAVERPPGRRADLMAYTRVLEGLADRGPVAPVQFGSFMRDREAVVEELLRPRAEDWRALLDALRGRRQFNLKASYLEEVVLGEVVAEQPAVAELRERTRTVSGDEAYADRVRLGELVSHAVAAKREADATFIYDTVLPHVVSYSSRHRGGIDHVLDAAFLVDDERRAEFEAVLEDLAEGMHERIRLQLVGPVPAYDFVEGDWWV